MEIMEIIESVEQSDYLTLINFKSDTTVISWAPFNGGFKNGIKHIINRTLKKEEREIKYTNDFYEKILRERGLEKSAAKTVILLTAVPQTYLERSEAVDAKTKLSVSAFCTVGLGNALAPADKATVHAVPAVTLWFSEPPSEGTVSVRLTDASGQAVATADPAEDPEDDKVFGVALPSALVPGGYTVSWRGMGGDGHVVRGEFAFTVAGH